MNDKDEINQGTELFGFIALEAQQNRLSVSLNRLYKNSGDDKMMIPMNIREDDFYFTLSNMKMSKVNGAALGAEYQHEAVEILDIPSDLVSKIGSCDFVRVEDGKLLGDFVSAQALLAYFREKGAKKIAIIGAGALAKSLLLESDDEFELSFYHEYIESLMSMSQDLERDVDINRLDENSDFSGFDLLLDASTAEDLSMIKALTPINIDLKREKEFSPLKDKALKNNYMYRGYDEFLPYLTQVIYNNTTKKHK